ncbi:sensor histidine kinase [Henriciella barbarensis]|uniref:sensor histidine kinase n=1 Tax=Henriciella barbarensis TaxID=86342 RepID=UPI0011C3F18E|nr:sensor histidine kinase [Henriciella barbarensis]
MADPSPFSNWMDIFDVSKEALMLIGEDGEIHASNRSMHRITEQAKPGQRLSPLLKEGDNALGVLLTHLRRSADPQPFNLLLKDETGEGLRLRGVGKRLRRSDHGVCFVLRFRTDDRNNFAALSLKVAELDSEVRARRAAQHSAEAALEINRLLTKELHHRVNNNLQLQISLLRRAARLTSNIEVRRFVEHAIGRLRAMSAGLDLTYQSGETGVDIADLAKKLASQIAETLPTELEIDLSLDGGFAVSVPQVTPLALIIHETMTRIFAPSDGAGDGRIELLVGQDEEGPWLQLSDNGQWADVPVDGDAAETNKLIDTLARQAGVVVLRTDEGGRRLRLRFVAVA